MHTVIQFIKTLFAPNDTARSELVGRDLMAHTHTYRIYVETYRTPAGRTFTRTIKENV